MTRELRLALQIDAHTRAIALDHMTALTSASAAIMAAVMAAHTHIKRESSI